MLYLHYIIKKSLRLLVYGVKMTKLFRKLCVIIAVVMSVFSLSACGFFDPVDKGGSDEIVLSVTDDPIVIEEGQSVTVTVVSPENKEALWLSENEEIAHVIDGEIVGIAEGSTTVTVIVGNKMLTVNIKITASTAPPEEPVRPLPPPLTDTPTTPTTPIDPDEPDTGDEGNDPDTPIATEKVTISNTSVTIKVGEQIQLSASASLGSSIIWSSKYPDIASVSAGKVTGVKEGSTFIYAKTAKGASAFCVVKVEEADDPNAEYRKDGYTLTWHDEFDGSSLDMSKWSYQVGTRDIYHGYDSQVWDWGNGELQYYTDGGNATVSGGALAITARREEREGKYFTSSRIVTRDKFSQTYGYFEVRMKTPALTGMWPAFWMLPQPSSYSNLTNGYGGWPQSGEIDIMEAKGSKINMVDTTLHFANTADRHEYITKEHTLNSPTDEWHTYAVDWTQDYIIWYIDGLQAYQLNSVAWNKMPGATSAQSPFDKPFYILLNLAVGGQYDGYKEPDAGFTSADMVVDYVRVWQNNRYN